MQPLARLTPALWVVWLTAANACTQVIVPSPTGEVVVANTVESQDFVHLHGAKMVHPTLRGDRLGGGRSNSCGGDCFSDVAARAAVPDSGQSSSSKASYIRDVREKLEGRCAEFTVKYGSVGAMNEKGLVVGHHLLKLSVYEEPVPPEAGICARDVEQWMLGSFASVRDLATVLQSSTRPRIVADPAGLPEDLVIEPRCWGVVDSTGEAVVVEFVKGGLRIHNNTVGVLTNDPPWDWHVSNLNNYAALQHTWYQTNNVGLGLPVSDAWYPWETNAYDADPPVVPAPIGHGLNLMGLPGDASAASRFVRVFFQRQYALHSNPPRDLEDAMVLGQELLNTVYLVKGAIAGMGPSDSLMTTPIGTLSIPATQVVYHRGRADLTWRMIDLKKLDFSPTAQRRHARVASSRFYAIDVTSFLTGNSTLPNSIEGFRI
eukprot:TRINITY_DN57928_c0_g1_i1.p1 TRINITY_DN57928_c0_g1~~TRINITY_DN57928_c0_g1_i1.p1  ORF type:complete len:458 (+),score=45.96 TRINITY_DN57928_c0_g1_i1:83-1375(+)